MNRRQIQIDASDSKDITENDLIKIKSKDITENDLFEININIQRHTIQFKTKLTKLIIR